MRGRIIERIEVGSRTYELRRDGRLLCLYAEGVLHTAFDERAIISGRIWDLLALPAIATQSSRVLVLGVGGGAAIRQMLAFGSPMHVDGVDLDAVHLELARKYFGLDDARVALHHEDARDFVARSTETYDCIVDDVFRDDDGEPRRAIAFDSDWAESLFARLRPGGVLVVNHASKAEVRAGVITRPAFAGRFETALTLETSTAGNVVVVLARTAMSPRDLRARARRALGDAADALDVEIRSRG